MQFTADDLLPGMVLDVAKQGLAITPRTIKVKISWIDHDTVYYRVEGETGVKDTPIDRFLFIVNQRIKP